MSAIKSLLSLPWMDIIRLALTIIGAFRNADKVRQERIKKALKRLNEKKKKERWDEGDVTQMLDDVSRIRRGV